MSDSPFELQKLVTVASYSFPWEAQVAQARLAAFGIPALIAGEHTIRMVALTYAFGGVHVQVGEKDQAAAREVLQHRAPLPEIYLVPAGELEPASPPRPTADELRPRGATPAFPPEDGEGDAAAHHAVVTVARFHTSWEAHLARTLLESEGIEACVLEERIPAVNLWSGAPLPFNRLEVHGSDCKRASALLARAWSSDEASGDRDAAAGLDHDLEES